MKAVALTTTHTADSFDDVSPDLVVGNLRHLPIDDLEALFEE